MGESLTTLAERCAAIELLIVDVDGVLSDGGLSYTEDGKELKRFDVRDGTGLTIWHRLGKRAALITGRTSRLVERRAAELHVDPVVQGAAEKLPAYRHILTATGFRPGQTCYLGDDLPDLPVLSSCGLAVAVADACPEVLAQAHYVTRARGGHGAVRETIELVLRCQDRWQNVIAGLRSERKDF